MLNDRKIKVAELASECGISSGSVSTNRRAFRHVKSISQVGTQKPEHARSSAKDGVKSKLGSVVVDFLFIVTPIVRVCNYSMF